MKKTLFNKRGISVRILLFTILLSGNIMAQEKQSADSVESPGFYEIAWDIYNSYETFKEQTLTNRRFKHSDIVPLIEQLKNKKNFKVDKVGKSVEGRDIYLISLGSGKTKVLTHRIAHLLEIKACNYENILAVTFTNKAANEMKKRVSVLLGNKRFTTYTSPLFWLGTFHAICLKLLKAKKSSPTCETSRTAKVYRISRDFLDIVIINH
jgi:hypothetical protein